MCNQFILLKDQKSVFPMETENLFANVCFEEDIVNES